MLYLITLISIIAHAFGVTINVCPPNYADAGANDCSKYTDSGPGSEFCCPDNLGTGAIQYKNRCYAECHNNDMVTGACGECCESLPADTCSSGTCFNGVCSGQANPMCNYVPLCDAQNSCEYKVRHNLVCTNSNSPDVCNQCVCPECGFGSFSKSCATNTDYCQPDDPDWNTIYDKCGKCFSDPINNCPQVSSYNCAQFPDINIAQPVCCFSEYTQSFNRYTDICRAECSGENLYYCGPCCEIGPPDTCSIGTCSDFGFQGTTDGVCMDNDISRCSLNLGYEAPCQIGALRACEYRGVSGMECVSQPFSGGNGGIVYCGQCQPIPTTTASGTTSSGTTSSGTTSSGTTSSGTTSSGTTSSGTTSSGTTSSGTTSSGTTSLGTTSSGTTSSGTTSSGTTSSGTSTTSSGTTDSGTTDSGTTDSGTTVAGTTGAGTTVTGGSGQSTTGRSVTSSTDNTKTTDDGGTTSAGPTTTVDICTTWDETPFEKLEEDICQFCFRRHGNIKKKCYKLVDWGLQLAQSIDWNEYGWELVDESCVFDYCKDQNTELVNCDLDRLRLKKKSDITADDCACNMFECVDPVNGSNASQIGVMVGIGFVMAIFGWM